METENPAVSVIMPAWNVQDYVVKSLDSVLSQEMRDFEIIFVNDGSTDDTLNIATEKLSNCGLPVVIVDQKDQGVSVARNVGLGKARGDYVVFFDADDIMKPGCLKRLYELAVDKDLDVAFCRYHIKKHGDIASKSPVREERAFLGIASGKEVLLGSWKGKIPLHIDTMMFKRKFLEKFDLKFNEKYLQGEDLDFWWRTLCLANMVGGVNEVLVYYINRPGSNTTGEYPSVQKSGSRTPFDRRFDPRSFKPFLEKYGNRELIDYFDKLFCPLLVLRRLRTMILQEWEEEFWEAIRDEEVRACLKRSWGSFFMKPEVFVKSLMALYAPRMFYRRYLKEKHESFSFTRNTD